jgi:hypothetical protein
MTEDDIQLLAALWRVEPPSDIVCGRARETLWAAVADEMISSDATADSETTRALPANSSARADRHRRAGLPPDSPL